MEAQLQVIKDQDGIMQLILNRPESLNALRQSLLHDLDKAIADAKADSSVKVILIRGAGKGFCAGADIKELADLTPLSAEKFTREAQAIFFRLEQCGKPSIAAVHGFALGGGCELAMATSIRIASATAKFGQPEVKLGVIPGFGGTQRLARLVGKGRALDLCLTGRTITAEQALQWGLVTQLFEETQLESAAMQIAKQLAALPEQALASILHVIHTGFDMTLETACEMEALHFSLCAATQDKQEGVSAFLEKRPARFGLAVKE